MKRILFTIVTVSFLAIGTSFAGDKKGCGSGDSACGAKQEEKASCAKDCAAGKCPKKAGDDKADCKNCGCQKA